LPDPLRALFPEAPPIRKFFDFPLTVTSYPAFECPKTTQTVNDIRDESGSDFELGIDRTSGGREFFIIF
jgi:hypothetical protein